MCHRASACVIPFNFLFLSLAGDRHRKSPLFHSLTLPELRFARGRPPLFPCRNSARVRSKKTTTTTNCRTHSLRATPRGKTQERRKNDDDEDDGKEHIKNPDYAAVLKCASPVVGGNPLPGGTRWYTLPCCCCWMRRN